MKKAVFSDLDGTLLKDNHRFSKLTKKTVNSVQKKEFRLWWQQVD
ncbi:HAD hydrolase family protein [Spiroplasma endosymbiont of Glossina fuscipes fuscipes]